MEQQYYLQDSRTYVGNSILWWAKNSSGYTTNIEEAELFNEEEVMKLFKNRITDVPWKKEDVEKAIIKIIDSQYLKKNKNDKFYLNLDKIKNEIKLLEKIELEKNNLNNYINEELYTISEHLYYINISSSEEFEIIFNNIKKEIDWNEYYYPTAYNKIDKELFDDLIKYKYLFKCECCKKYFTTLEKYEDTKHDFCYKCGEEDFYKNNGWK